MSDILNNTPNTNDIAVDRPAGSEGATTNNAETTPVVAGAKKIFKIPKSIYADKGARSGSFGPRKPMSADDKKKSVKFNDRGGKRDFNKRGPQVEELESKLIILRRVTKVTKGGKNMKFSALVVVGDRKGKVGFGLRKGLDFQDALAKATKKANQNLVKVNIDENGSIAFPSYTKFGAVELFLKPATPGTGLIAGGFLRPVLELAGITNVYSKITRSRNKVAGVEAVFKALAQYSK